MGERTKGTLIFDGLKSNQHTYWLPRDSEGRERYEQLERGARLEDVDLEKNPELRGPLLTGAARWEDEGKTKKAEPKAPAV